MLTGYHEQNNSSFSYHSRGEKQVTLSRLWKVAMSVFLAPAPKKRIHRGWRFMSVHFKQGSQLDKSCFSVWLNQACTDKLNQMLMWARLPSETCMVWIVPLSAPTGSWDVLSLLRSLDVVKTSLPLPWLTRRIVFPSMCENTWLMRTWTFQTIVRVVMRRTCYREEM